MFSLHPFRIDPIQRDQDYLDRQQEDAEYEHRTNRPYLMPAFTAGDLVFDD